MRSIEDVYAEIPSIECRGKCAVSCGPIDLTDQERRRLADLGVTIPRWTPELAQRWANQERLDCPALGAFRQCTVYDARPLICRLWGVTEGMRCPFGCRPERILTDREAFELIVESMRIGGHPRYNDRMLAKAARAFDDDDLAAALAEILSGGR